MKVLLEPRAMVGAKLVRLSLHAAAEDPRVAGGAAVATLGGTNLRSSGSFPRRGLDHVFAGIARAVHQTLLLDA